MVEMHLLVVNVEFRYDPFYALGVMTTFDRFMQGYRPESDRDPIFQAICEAVGQNPQQIQQDANRLKDLAHSTKTLELVEFLSNPSHREGWEDISQSLMAIAAQETFKYSRLFAIGLYTVLETADADLVKDEKRRTEAFKQICTGLHLPEDKVQKDLELYRSNLEKMEQAILVLKDALEADRKKREKRALEKEAAAAAKNVSSSTDSNAPSGSN